VVEVSTNSKETGLLLLPDGAFRWDLRRQQVFRDYALKHAHNWYTLSMGPSSAWLERVTSILSPASPSRHPGVSQPSKITPARESPTRPSPPPHPKPKPKTYPYITYKNAPRYYEPEPEPETPGARRVFACSLLFVFFCARSVGVWCARMRTRMARHDTAAMTRMSRTQKLRDARKEPKIPTETDTNTDTIHTSLPHPFPSRLATSHHQPVI
jgi:hypothetical protein